MAEIREKAARGQTIISQTSPDKSSVQVKSNPQSFVGRPMKGSGTDTSAATKAGGYNDESRKGNIPT